MRPKITLPSKMTRGKKYYHLSIPYGNDWVNASIVPLNDSSKAIYDGNQNYADHVFYEDGDCQNESLIIALAMEIRALAIHHACIDALCHIKNNVSQQLYWVYTENISHVCKIGIRAESAKPINMYAGNCYYTRVEAEAFREELKTLFNKYGISINYIN